MARFLRNLMLVATLAPALTACPRVCEGDACACASDDDCTLGCSPDPDAGGCDCLNDWPVPAGEVDNRECPAAGLCEAIDVNCADHPQYEPRCNLGRCVAVPR